MKVVLAYLLDLLMLFAASWAAQAAQRQPWRGSRVWIMVVPVSIAVALALFAVTEPQPYFDDFRVAYYRTAVVLDDPAGLATMFGPNDGFVNLPILAFVFAPLGTLDFAWSIALFTALGIASVLWCWRLLARQADLDTLGAAFLFFLFAANGPLLYDFREGNTSHFILLLIVAAFIAQRSGRFVASGALLGIAALFKLPLLLFGLYYAFRRRWGAVAAGAVICVIAAGLSLAIFGWDIHVKWYNECIRDYASLPISGLNAQSIQSFLARLERGATGLTEWTPRPLSPGNQWFGRALVAGLYLLVLAVFVRNKDGDGAVRDVGRTSLASRDLEFMVVLILAMVTSTVSWSHYFCWLLFPIAFFLGPTGLLPQQGRARILVWLALLPAMLPVVREDDWISWRMQDLFARSAASLHLAAALFLLAWLLWKLWQLQPPSQPRAAAG